MKFSRNTQIGFAAAAPVLIAAADVLISANRRRPRSPKAKIVHKKDSAFFQHALQFILVLRDSDFWCVVLKVSGVLLPDGRMRRLEDAANSRKIHQALPSDAEMISRCFPTW